jgi:hypothetical protein
MPMAAPITYTLKAEREMPLHLSLQKKWERKKQA